VAYPTRRFGRLYRPENPQIALLRVWFVRCAARAPPQLHHDLMDETALQSQLQAARDELRYLERELPNFVRLRDENQRLAAPSRSCPRGQSRCCRAG
jgi:cob(I)alamin adenosyltransferase